MLESFLISIGGFQPAHEMLCEKLKIFCFVSGPFYSESRDWWEIDILGAKVLRKSATKAQLIFGFRKLEVIHSYLFRLFLYIHMELESDTIQLLRYAGSVSRRRSILMHKARDLEMSMKAMSIQARAMVNLRKKLQTMSKKKEHWNFVSSIRFITVRINCTGLNVQKAFSKFCTAQSFHSE